MYELLSQDCIKLNIQTSIEWGWIFITGFVFTELKWLLYQPFIMNLFENKNLLSRIINATNITGYIMQLIGIFWFMKVYFGL